MIGHYLAEIYIRLSFCHGYNTRRKTTPVCPEWKCFEILCVERNKEFLFTKVSEKASPRWEWRHSFQLGWRKVFLQDIWIIFPGKSLDLLRNMLEQNACGLNQWCKFHIQKVLNATKNLFVERSLLPQWNQELFRQNTEKCFRQNTKSSVIEKAKIMEYEDIIAAKRRRRKEERSRPLKQRKPRKSASKAGRTRHFASAYKIVLLCSPTLIFTFIFCKFDGLMEFS